MSQPNVTRGSTAFRQPDRSSQANNSFNQSYDKRIPGRQTQPQLLTSNAVNIYSDPNYRSSNRVGQDPSSASSMRMPFAESNTKPASAFR